MIPEVSIVVDYDYIFSTAITVFGRIGTVLKGQHSTGSVGIVNWYIVCQH